MEDKRLIKKCQNGDKNAFEELISKYHPVVYKFLIRVTKDEKLSEDLVQETFIKIIRNIDNFDVEGKAKFSTYIITVSRNCYIDYLRKNREFMQDIAMDDSLNIVDNGVNVERIVLDKIYIEDILKTMENLTEEQKIAIKLKYIEGLTLKEIADMLDIQPKTVKSRIHNGIVKLRQLLKR